MTDPHEPDVPPGPALEALRTDLDRVGERFLDSLRDRLECCKSI